MKKPFTSDHCSVVPDFDHAACCVTHDWLYWQGGSRLDRKNADRAFYKCLRTRTSWRHARIRWLGVRLGGIGYFPLPWRWGYGWRWPRTKPRERDRSKFTAESQKETFESILESARAADEQARKR